MTPNDSKNCIRMCDCPLLFMAFDIKWKWISFTSFIINKIRTSSCCMNVIVSKDVVKVANNMEARKYLETNNKECEWHKKRNLLSDDAFVFITCVAYGVRTKQQAVQQYIFILLTNAKWEKERSLGKTFFNSETFFSFLFVDFFLARGSTK